MLNVPFWIYEKDKYSCCDDWILMADLLGGYGGEKANLQPIVSSNSVRLRYCGV
jgi:hypothetical protein